MGKMVFAGIGFGIAAVLLLLVAVLALPAVRPVTAYETVVDGDEVLVRLS